MFEKLRGRRRVSPVTGNESTQDAPQTDGVDGASALAGQQPEPSQPAPDSTATSSDPPVQGQGLSEADDSSTDVPPGADTTSSGADDENDDDTDETKWGGIKSALDDEGEALLLLTEGDVALEMDEKVAEDELEMDELEMDELEDIGVSAENVLTSLRTTYLYTPAWCRLTLLKRSL